VPHVEPRTLRGVDVTKLHRCPECGAIDWRTSIPHVLRYVFSARYRERQKEAERWLVAWEEYMQRPPIGLGTTIHVPYIERLHAEDS